MLEFGAAKPGGEFASVGYRYVAGFLAYDYGQCVGGLSNAKGGAVAQAERAWHVAVVAYGEDAAGGFDAAMGDNHGAVVEW